MDKSNKDKEMASHMKQKGIDRHTGRCPICHALVSVNRVARQSITNGMYTHIITCQGSRKSRAEVRTPFRREKQYA